MAHDARQRRAIMVGAATSVVFHLLLGLLLFAAASNGRQRRPLEEEAAAARRRPAAGPVTVHGRRPIEGPFPRLQQLSESRRSRRPILDIRGRRVAAPAAARPYRFLELARGRRGLEAELGHKARTIDFGPADDTILKAMLIPRLGMKKADPHKLPRLTKYEQPEKVEAGINISRDNPDAREIKHKSFKKKKAETDRRRKKKPTLSELIDAPEEDDPRMRPTRLDDIVGVEGGSTSGTGTEGDVGNLYLGKIEASIRKSFHIPVFLTRDQLEKLSVDIEIRQMDAKGHILAYKLRRKSSSDGFNSAALEAIKRFVPKEGGSRTLPAPTAEMLQRINRRGILVRLEGKRLR